MFIHTSRHGDLFFVTITTEVPDSSEGSTATFRFNREDANFLCQQLAQELNDWHLENEGDEHDDPHERAALIAEYKTEQLEDKDVLLFLEPF